MGVYSPHLVEKLALVLGRLGSKRALVVCGEGGMDEITITGPTRVADWADGKVSTYSLSPERFGLRQATLEEIRGGATPEAAADQLRSVLAGQEGARLDMVLLNAGAALLAAGKVTAFEAGVEMAREIIFSGAAQAKLEALVAFSQQERPARRR
jgi:anthranilate phosphoribosyltransferase